MATVYSLICFGGRTGKAVTLSISSPCVATLTRHGLRNGSGVVFSTTGTLPSGITAGTSYYARSTGDDTFSLYDTQANAIAGGSTGRVNTSGTQSGAHYAKSKKMLDLFAAYPGRWGDAGSERAYDGVATWISGRSGASQFDNEVGEIGESYSDYVTSQQTFSVPAASSLLTTMLAGSRSAGFHSGNYPNTVSLTSGYEMVQVGGGGSAVYFDRSQCHIEGFIIRQTVGADSVDGSGLAGLCSIKNCIHVGGSWSNYGIFLQGRYNVIERNLIVGGRANGIWMYDWETTSVFGNFVTGCSKGITGGGAPRGYLYNNICLGNGTNWDLSATYLFASSNNAGLSGEAPIVGSGTRITVATTDFVDFANKNFRPASAASPQVETGAFFYGAQGLDISGRVCPDYMNGAAAYFDVGPYEFDHGYGPWPASATISLTNIVSGSRVLITKSGDGTVLYNDVPGGSLSFSTSHIGDFSVAVRKATTSPFYREFQASGTTVADQTTSIKCLQQLDE